MGNEKSWFQNARIYHIFTDRFAGMKKEYTEEEIEKNFLYGNLRAALEKLDYIKSLNFNMIWISPFFVNQPNGFHGYHAINFNHVDPRIAFGENSPDKEIGNPLNENDLELMTNSDKFLQYFIEECHKKNIKVLMDFVPNHLYKTHPFFQDALNNTSSKYRNWFYFLNKELEDNKNMKYLTFLNFEELPKLNLDNTECGEYIIKVLNKFLNFGIDAIRIDHCPGPSLNFLKKLKENISKKFPKVPIIGECIPIGVSKFYNTINSVPKEYLEKIEKFDVNNIQDLDEVFNLYKECFDGVIDFSFQHIVVWYGEGKITEEKCLELINEHYKRFDKNFVLIKNIDSHDTDRILFKCNNDIEKFKKCLNLLLRKYEGRIDPLIWYYGTEDCMSQDKTVFEKVGDDYRCRMPMKFKYQTINETFKDNLIQNN